MIDEKCTMSEIENVVYQNGCKLAEDIKCFLINHAIGSDCFYTELGQISVDNDMGDASNLKLATDILHSYTTGQLS